MMFWLSAAGVAPPVGRERSSMATLHPVQAVFCGNVKFSVYPLEQPINRPTGKQYRPHI
jgi:hypothetical protein